MVEEPSNDDNSICLLNEEKMEELKSERKMVNIDFGDASGIEEP